MQVCRIGKPLRFVTFGVLKVMVVLGAVITAVLWYSFSNSVNMDQTGTWVFALGWFGSVGIGWVYYFDLPLEIRLKNDNTLECRKIFGSRMIPIKDITAIEANPVKVGFLKIVYRNGSQEVLNHMDGFHTMLQTLQSLNPEIRTKGF